MKFSKAVVAAAAAAPAVLFLQGCSSKDRFGNETDGSDVPPASELVNLWTGTWSGHDVALNQNGMVLTNKTLELIVNPNSPYAEYGVGEVFGYIGYTVLKEDDFGNDPDGTKVRVGGDWAAGQIDFKSGEIKLVEISGEVAIVRGTMIWKGEKKQSIFLDQVQLLAIQTKRFGNSSSEEIKTARGDYVIALMYLDRMSGTAPTFSPNPKGSPYEKKMACELNRLCQKRCDKADGRHKLFWCEYCGPEPKQSEPHIFGPLGAEDFCDN